MSSLKLFLSGDVMTGRGVDQILPNSGDPILFESDMNHAGGYVSLAEQIHGPLPGNVSYNYIWGDALNELEQRRPDVRMINLETSITRCDRPWPGKGIHYRMHPDNVPCLSAADIDACILANNHTLDWGREGLRETLDTLDQVQIQTAGAGRNREESEVPTRFFPNEDRGLLVYAYATGSSGVPRDWQAGPDRPGINQLPDLSSESLQRVLGDIERTRSERDRVVVSLHWGFNWGYDIPLEQRRFAHQLIEKGKVDLVHGHSSHHVKGIEVYRGRLILYGCGDFLNDYEGISGHEAYRGDLGLMYFPSMEADRGGLQSLRMTPTQIRNLRVHRAEEDDIHRLKKILDREGQEFGTRTVLQPDHSLWLQWEET